MQGAFLVQKGNNMNSETVSWIVSGEGKAIGKTTNKATILGTEYNIIVDDSIILNNVDGLCKSYDKEIIIRSANKMLSSDDSIETKETRFKEVLRHEIIHAFLDESGLDDYSNNEQLVQWLASQFPKMQKVFTELGCI